MSQKFEDSDFLKQELEKLEVYKLEDPDSDEWEVIDKSRIELIKILDEYSVKVSTDSFSVYAVVESNVTLSSGESGKDTVFEFNIWGYLLGFVLFCMCVVIVVINIRTQLLNRQRRRTEQQAIDVQFT